ncbi:Na+/H+ antiporter subunit B [soil metagenome]
MDSLLLRTAARIIVPVQLLWSVYLLVRGHNEPGGGFIGGLLAAGAIILHGIANGMPAARQLLRVRPQTLIGLGIAAAGLSGVIPMLAGLPYLTGVWGFGFPTLVAGTLKFGSPLLFDVAVYLVVTGVGTLLIFAAAEESEEG